jgi:hypothetical protein
MKSIIASERTSIENSLPQAPTFVGLFPSEYLGIILLFKGKIHLGGGEERNL